jgi:2-keto-4-pentenoate hydratase/2-oxohepta-3-ene-1,7-dioic acid hydratase in catechol pathway
VISKTGRDIPVADAGNYILGYTVGNDLTARLFQDPKKSGGQFTFAKGFDNFAPLGPRLVSPAAFEAQARNLVTKINGKVVQDSPIDFVFSVHQIVSFLSQGVYAAASS